MTNIIMPTGRNWLAGTILINRHMGRPTEVRLENSGQSHGDHYDITLPIAYYFDQDHTRLYISTVTRQPDSGSSLIIST